MKSLENSQKMTAIVGGVATIIIVLGLGLGLGLGIGLRGDSNGSNSTTSRLDFSVQDVNDRLNSVLAVKVDGSKNINFNNFAYLKSSSLPSLTLNSGSENTVSFDFATGASNNLYNGFGSIGSQRFYIPIKIEGNANYLVIQGANSTNSVTKFLYVEGVGVFNSETKAFNQDFTALDLTNTNLTIDLTFEAGTPTAVPTANEVGLGFEVQDFSARLGNVLAVDVTNRDLSYFSQLAYVESALPEQLSLTNGSSSTAEFTITPGSSNVLTNGFNQNGKLYVPIIDGDTSRLANYMVLKRAFSDNGNSQYLYVDGIGDFNSQNIFDEPFLATQLTNTPSLDLTLSTSGDPDSIPTPSTSGSQDFDFTTSNPNLDTGNSLHFKSTADENLDNLLYITTSIPDDINFQTQSSGNISISFLSGSNNRSVFAGNTLFVPINSVTVGGQRENYLGISQVVDNSGDAYWVFTGLANSINYFSLGTQFYNLNNDNTLGVNLTFVVDSVS